MRRVAVVTGGASGIGLALGAAFGPRVDAVVLADVDEAALARACADLVAAGIEAHAHPVDLRDRAGVEGLADAAERLGATVVACFNAGVATAGASSWDTPTAATEFVFDVNLRGFLHCIEAFVPRLVQAEAPSHVVATASMAGMVSSPGRAAYGASKAAVISYMRSMRAELAAVAPHVGVAVLNPSVVRTNIPLSSAVLQPTGTGFAPAVAAQVHQLLDTTGVSPDEVARWVVDAVDAGRFWVMPPSDNSHSVQLLAELDELGRDIERA